MTTRLRPAAGVALLFLANGLTGPALWPRFPEIRDAVGASAVGFGFALLGTGLGGILGSVLSPIVTSRAGVPRVATVSATALALAGIGVGVAPNLPALLVAFAVLGLCDGLADVSQNALLFDVQRTGSRSLASRMHAVWSGGALAGTAVGTFAAAARVGVTAQMMILGVVGASLVAVASRPVARLGACRPPSVGVAGPGPGPLSGRGGRRSGSPRRVRAWAWVLVAGVVVAAVEGVASEWSALTLRDGLGASVGLAGLGPTAFAASMFGGRLVGDRAIDRFGPGRVAALGGVAVVAGSGAGLALASWWQLPALLVVGLVVAGFGTATLFPLMLAAGDGLDRSGGGVAVASFGARSGFLAVPVVVGALSDLAGPTVGFALLPLAGLVAAVALPAALRIRPR